MSTIRIRARGPASKYEIWARYRDPGRWPSWAPHVRAVVADGPLRPGLEGEVLGRFGVRARFEVLEVDEARGRWTWAVRAGPIRLRIEHVVDEGLAGLVISGPVVAVAAYAPIARRALRRLVAR